jgi:hypothetical protein
MHFRGEIAEFYVQTILEGQAVNASITNATLFKPDGSMRNLTTQSVALGLYKIPYNIPGNAESGTYTLVVSAEYVTVPVHSVGVSLKSFLISSTLTNLNAVIGQIEGDIATIVVPELGVIKTNLSSIDAKIVGINGNLAILNSTLGTIQTTLDVIRLNVTAINGTAASIQTMLGLMNGTVTSMISSVNGTIATIVIPQIGTIQADVSDLKGQEQALAPQLMAAIVIALIAAVGSLATVIMMIRRRRSKTSEASTLS